MDDNLRNRLRSPRRSYETPSYSRRVPTSQPVQSIPKQQPRPMTYQQPAQAAPVHPQPRRQPQQRSVPASVAQKPSTPPKRHRKPRSKRGFLKKLSIIFVVILLVAGAVYGVYVLRSNKEVTQTRDQQDAPTATSAEEKPTGTVRMIAVGDSLAFDSINSAARTADGYNYLPLMETLKPFFDKSDVRLCNQTTPAGGEALGISGYPTFNAPVAWSAGFASLGCNVINLASDHANDKGQAAIDATISSWTSAPNILAYAGVNSSAEEQAKIKYFTVKGLKFAYLSYTTSVRAPGAAPFAVNVYSDDLAKRQVEEARKNANLVIVSMYWGEEDKTDINADQERIAQTLASYNVDVIVGTGPHVLQPAKILDGVGGHQTLVWYSLGNFLNSQIPTANLIGGMAIMDFDAADGKLRGPKLMPIYMHYEWTAQERASSNTNARRNFKLMPLDIAADALAASQNNTTVDEQTNRVRDIITKFAPIGVVTSSDF